LGNLNIAFIAIFIDYILYTYEKFPSSSFALKSLQQRLNPIGGLMRGGGFKDQPVLMAQG